MAETADGRLVTGRVPRRGYDPDTGPRLGLAVDLLDDRAREVGHVRQVGVLGVGPSVRELGSLDQDRSAGEMTVSSRVVRMQVAVGDELRVPALVTRRAQRIVDGPHLDRCETLDELLWLR